MIAEELESVVQLFADVLRSYEIAPEEIEAHEETIRGAGYALLRREAAPAATDAAVVCGLEGRCFDTRAVSSCAQTPRPWAAASASSISRPRGLTVADHPPWTRHPSPTPPATLRLQAGDELELTGSADAFAGAAPLFRPGSAEVAEIVPTMPGRRRVDTSATVELTLDASDVVHAHCGRIRPVRPQRRGCEECLRIGDAWVHLRVCMTCGHVGCCDSSPNKHATAHHHGTGHPIMRSLEPGENWGWCYVDEALLE